VDGGAAGVDAREVGRAVAVDVPGGDEGPCLSGYHPSWAAHTHLHASSAAQCVKAGGSVEESSEAAGEPHDLINLHKVIA